MDKHFRIAKRLRESAQHFLLSLDPRRWHRKKQIHFFVNILMGILIGVLCHFLEHTRIGEKVVNASIDIMTAKETSDTLDEYYSCKQGNSKGCRSIEKRMSDRIVFITIDQETYKAWGDPLLTPRDKLADILDNCKRANIVIVDFAFEYNSCSGRRIASRGCPADEKLKAAIERLIQGNPNLHVILPAQTTREDQTIKRSVYDEVIVGNPGRVHLALSSVHLSEADMVARYMRHIKVARTQDGKTVVLFGSQILPILLAQGITPDTAAANLLKRYPSGNIPPDLDLSPWALSSRGEIELEHADLYANRIRYFLIPPGLPHYAQGNLGLKNRLTVDQLPDFTEEFAGKTVIIGSTASDHNDIHKTPIGEVAGIYIIGNSLNTLSQGHVLRLASAWVRIPLEIIVIIFAAYLFLHVHSILAQVISTVVILVFLGPLTAYLFTEHAIFLNSIFSILGMSAHRVIDDVEEVILHGGRKKDHP